MSYCGKCGAELAPGQSFCGKCGQYVGSSHTSSDSADGYKSDTKKSGGQPSSSFIDGLSGYMGHTKNVDLNWKDLFTNVFKRHTREEAEDIFICGTSRTTPPIDEVSATWPKPWLYSRVFLCFIATFVLLYVCSVIFVNPNTWPGLMIVGSFAVPFATIVLFMEVNAFRNISIYSIFIYFLVGGCASLVVTLFLFDLRLVSTDTSTTWGAMMVGVIEELGKAIIVYVLLRRMGNVTHILPALLIGACVGGGFAAFESAGYAMRPMLSGGYQTVYQMLDNILGIIYLRGFLAPGGHVAWAAITAAAMVIATGTAPITASVFTNSRFLKIFAIPVVLHGLWDAPFMMDGYLKFVGLIVMVWIVVLILINMGLDQVSKLKQG